MIKIKERGWAAHFICADNCMYKRNTLISDSNISIVVSSVGSMVRRHDNRITETMVEIGHDRVYETMVFVAKEDDGYIEADVTKQLFIDTKWSLSKSELRSDNDNQADDMHEANVAEVVRLIENGEIIEMIREQTNDN